MRPLHLKISAFGPYAGVTEIPMDKLGEKGLYLITGATGAGKTIIFDAICYALYGEASGENREPGMLRSKYASPETPTEVVLTFVHRGKEYRVRRNPEYMRPAKKGTGETKQTAGGEITMPDGSVISGTKDVTRKVVDILGINRDQFAKIAMLAQGDFLKILLASTRERIEIFRNIFKTDNYVTLQQALSSEASTLKDAVDKNRTFIQRDISGIRVDPDDTDSIDVEKAKNGEMLTEDVVALLDKLIAKDSQAAKKNEEESAKVNAELEEVNKRLGNLATVEAAREALKKGREKLALENSAEAGLKEALEKASKDLERKESLLKDANSIELLLPKYETFSKLSRSISGAESNIRIMTEQSSKKTSEKEEKEEKKNKLKTEQESLKDIAAVIEKIQGDIRQNENDSKQLNTLAEALKKYNTATAAYRSSQERFKAQENEYEALNAMATDLERRFRRGQAGLLAKDLEEGMPCPVCGCTHHEKLAECSADTPSEEEVDSARDAANKSKGELDSFAGELKKTGTVLEQDEKDLKASCEEILGNPDIASASGIIEGKLAELKSSRGILDADMAEAQTNKTRKETLDKQIPILEGNIKNLESEINKAGKDISALTATMESDRNQLAELSKELKYPTKEKAQNELKRLTAEAKVLQDSFDNANNAVNDQRTRIGQLNATIEANQKTISETKVTDPQQDQELQAKLNGDQAALFDAGKVISGRLDTNRGIRKSISGLSSDMAETEKKLQWVKALSDTANGKLNGKEKIMLETYIQTAYFDRILRKANQRLLVMSSNQYELIRLKDSTGNAQAGLDLGVRDHYNSTERSVKTLSGGESFMASLCLALGLSDEVQSSAGGIRIDTMFVDEGFGTLDPETLNMAFKALASLTEGDRIVGIISHVEELKRRIDDKQIIVTKTAGSGSTVELVY